MNEKSPHSHGGGDGSTVVVAVVLTVVVVLFAALAAVGLFVYKFAVPFRSIGQPAAPNAVTTAQYAPVEIVEEIGEPVTGPPLATDVDSTTEATDDVSEQEPDNVDVETVMEGPAPTITPEADPISEPSDVTPSPDETVEDDTMPPADETVEGDTIPPADETVEDDTMPPVDETVEGDTIPPADETPADETVEDDTMPPADETVGDDAPPSKKETPTTGNYQSLPQAFERVGVKADGDDAPRAVAFSGRKCKSVIWAQPDEDEGVSQVSYMLDGKFATLRGVAGIGDAADDAEPGDQKPSVVFRIYGDGNLLWESDPQTGFGASQPFEVPVKGIEVLALAAESSSSSELSRFAWGDVELGAAEE